MLGCCLGSVIGLFTRTSRSFQGGSHPVLGMCWILARVGPSAWGTLTSSVCNWAAWLEKSLGDCWHSWQTWEI